VLDKTKIIRLLCISLLLCSLASGKQQLLPQKSIPNIKKGPCTFLHVWATWCTICIQEMPALLKFLAEQKKVKPVVLDVSAPFVQKQFSIKWMDSLKPAFTTYRKPNVDEAKYLFAIDNYWSGALPYSALYKNGTQKKVWVGALNAAELKETLARECH